jgi:hypothetical protein
MVIKRSYLPVIIIINVVNAVSNVFLVIYVVDMCVAIPSCFKWITKEMEHHFILKDLILIKDVIVVIFAFVVSVWIVLFALEINYI